MRGFWCRSLLCLLAMPCLSWASDMRIAVLAHRGPERALEQWTPTAEYLQVTIPEHTFSILPMTLGEVARAVEKDTVDFVITNTGQYVELEATSGLSRLATLKNRIANTTATEFGAVIFTRADRFDIETLHDVRGKSMMAIQPDGFGGYQMALRELLEAGIDPRRDASLLRFSGFPGERIAFAVKAGEVDFGTFRTGLLEALAAEGKIQLSDFKIIHQNKSERFNGLLSTRLYPEWPFARLRHTPLDDAERVAVALINLTPDLPAARAAGIVGWTVPLDYYPVHELFLALGVGPYALNDNDRLGDFIRRYPLWFAGLCALGLSLTTMTILLVRVNRKRRIAEKNLSAHHSELAKIVQTTTIDLVRARDDALASSEAKSRFLANMSHELRTPLNAIIGYSEIIGEAINDAQLTECHGDVDKIVTASHHLVKLIDDIFDLEKIETGVLPFHLALFNARGMVQDVISIMRPLADINHNELSARVDEGVSMIQGDLLRTKQILFNVINNACKFTNGGLIELKVTQQVRNKRNGLLFTVQDSGCGMSKDQCSQAFDRFHSINKTTEVGEGTRLGLATSRDYCELLGGQIEIVSHVDVGTTLNIWLPEYAEVNSKTDLSMTA